VAATSFWSRKTAAALAVLAASGQALPPMPAPIM